MVKQRAAYQNAFDSPQVQVGEDVSNGRPNEVIEFVTFSNIPCLKVTTHLWKGHKKPSQKGHKELSGKSQTDSIWMFTLYTTWKIWIVQLFSKSLARFCGDRVDRPLLAWRLQAAPAPPACNPRRYVQGWVSCCTQILFLEVPTAIVYRFGLRVETAMQIKPRLLAI